MKTAVAQTSIAAYHDTEKQRDKQSEVVLDAVRTSGYEGTCIADVACKTGIDKSSVAGRLNELKEKDKIEFVGKRPSKATGRTSEHWRVPAIPDDLFGYVNF